MKLKVGKKYRTRGGYVAEITGKYRKKDTYPFEGSVRGTNTSWTKDGRHVLGGDSDFDLVKEIPLVRNEYRGLFDFLAEKHGLILIQTEMDEVIEAVKKHLGL